MKYFITTGEVNHLYEEATMPIEHVIAKYQGELLPRKEVADNGEPLPGTHSNFVTIIFVVLYFTFSQN